MRVSLWGNPPLVPAQQGLFGVVQGLIVLNMGLGRDSLAMLCLLVNNELRVNGRLITPADVAAVVFADAGAEWAHTYDQIPRVQRLCEAAGLRWIVLAKPPEADWRPWVEDQRSARAAARVRGEAYRAPTVPWAYKGSSIEERAATGGYHLRPPIMEDFGGKDTIATRSDASCTGNHKIQPIRRLLEDLAIERYGAWATNRAWGEAVRRGSHTPHLNLIGIAADETHRIQDGGDVGCFDAAYTSEAYPLVEMGITKPAEEEILRRCGLADARKSGCYLCPHQPVGWFWVLRETDPATWARVVNYEARAIARGGVKLAISGRAPIAQQVERWRERNPDATIAEVLAKTYGKCSKRPDDPLANPLAACSVEDQRLATAWTGLGLEEWASHMRATRLNPRSGEVVWGASPSRFRTDVRWPALRELVLLAREAGLGEVSRFMELHGRELAESWLEPVPVWRRAPDAVSIVVRGDAPWAFLEMEVRDRMREEWLNRFVDGSRTVQLVYPFVVQGWDQQHDRLTLPRDPEVLWRLREWVITWSNALDDENQEGQVDAEIRAINRSLIRAATSLSGRILAAYQKIGGQYPPPREWDDG